MRTYPMFAILGSLMFITANSANADSHYGGYRSHGYTDASVSFGDYGHGNYGQSYYGPGHRYGFDYGRCSERRNSAYRKCNNFGFRDRGQRRTSVGFCPGGRFLDRPMPIDRRDLRVQQQSPRSSPNAPGRPQNNLIPRGPDRAAPKTTIPPIPGLVPPNQEQGAPVPKTDVNP